MCSLSGSASSKGDELHLCCCNGSDIIKDSRESSNVCSAPDHEADVSVCQTQLKELLVLHFPFRRLAYELRAHTHTQHVPCRGANDSVNYRSTATSSGQYLTSSPLAVTPAGAGVTELVSAGTGGKVKNFLLLAMNANAHTYNCNMVS